jgi:hypothetical protein
MKANSSKLHHLCTMIAHQVGYVGHLNGVVHDFAPGASVPLVEHGLIDDQCSLYVLRGLSDVPLESKHHLGSALNEAHVLRSPVVLSPLEVARIGATLVGFGAGFEYDMWVLLLKQSAGWAVLSNFDTCSVRSESLAQISIIKHPLKATITDLKFSPFGIDIGKFEIQLLDLKE